MDMEEVFPSESEQNAMPVVQTRMKRSQVFVPWREGLHLRPATRLVRMAQQFRSTIILKCSGRLADARSIISVLLLAATMGVAVDVEISGDDEETAAQAIKHIFSFDDDDRGA